MSLAESQRLRFARHLLLPEIGLRGQARLCNAQVQLRGGRSELAREVARSYLERSGVRVLEGTGPDLEVDLPSVSALAGRPALSEAAAALSGAFAAVETIKALLAVGDPATLPPDLSLSDEGEP